MAQHVEHHYWQARSRTKVCRFCGEEFTTTHPRQKTCLKPECQRKADELRKKRLRDVGRQQREHRRAMREKEAANV